MAALIRQSQTEDEGEGEPEFVLAELEYFNEPPHPQPDGFHSHIFLRRADRSRSLDAAGSVTAAVPPRRGAGTCGLPLDPGRVEEMAVSGSPVPQPFIGIGLFHWLTRVRAASVQARHPLWVTTTNAPSLRILCWTLFALLSPACRICTHNNKHENHKDGFYFKRSVAWRGSCVTSWLHLAADDPAYRVTLGGTPDMLPGHAGRR